MKNIAVSSNESIYFNSYRNVAASPDGYYLQTNVGMSDGNGYLSYIDKNSGKETFLCSKPDCSHVDDSFFRCPIESCDAYLHCPMMESVQWYNGYVYVLEYDKETYDVTLVRISGDGSVHEKVMKIGQAPNYGAYYKYVIADDETIYMTYDDPETAGMECTVSLNQVDLKTKEITPVYTYSGPNASVSYSLMILNRSLFFMQVTKEDNVYQQYLMKYDMDTGKTEAVLEEVITSYTLVGNGKLVYSVPKDGLYLYDMGTGLTEKIRSCDDETMYVNLAWDGTYLYLENLQNRIFYDTESKRKIFVCTLEGETVNELKGGMDYAQLCDGDYILIKLYADGALPSWAYIKGSDVVNPDAEWTALRPE